jgi:hypothetical protein
VEQKETGGTKETLDVAAFGASRLGWEIGGLSNDEGSLLEARTGRRESGIEDTSQEASQPNLMFFFVPVGVTTKGGHIVLTQTSQTCARNYLVRRRLGSRDRLQRGSFDAVGGLCGGPGSSTARKQGAWHAERVGKMRKRCQVLLATAWISRDGMELLVGCCPSCAVRGLGRERGGGWGRKALPTVARTYRSILKAQA